MKILLNLKFLHFKANSVLVVLVFLSVVLACNLRTDKETSMVIKEFKKRGISFDCELKYCLIIPEVGCGGCIGEGVGFIKRNLNTLRDNHNKIKVIFTSVLSKKMLLRNIGITDLEDYYFIIDKNNNYKLSNNKSIYPLVLYLSNGIIKKAEFQSPNTPNVMYSLEKHLSQ